MGDKGKLPATKSMSDSVPDMTGPRTAENPNDTNAGADATTGQKRMGDKGKLPATGTMTDQVPKMTGPDATK